MTPKLESNALPSIATHPLRLTPRRESTHVCNMAPESSPTQLHGHQRGSTPCANNRQLGPDLQHRGTHETCAHTVGEGLTSDELQTLQHILKQHEWCVSILCRTPFPIRWVQGLTKAKIKYKRVGRLCLHVTPQHRVHFEIFFSSLGSHRSPTLQTPCVLVLSNKAVSLDVVNPFVGGVITLTSIPHGSTLKG